MEPLESDPWRRLVRAQKWVKAAKASYDRQHALAMEAERDLDAADRELVAAKDGIAEAARARAATA